MNKRLALATAAVGSTVILSGILGLSTINAQEANQDSFRDRLQTRMQEFWGEDFDEEKFEERFDVFQSNREEKKIERETEFNSSELSEYLNLDFTELKELHSNGTTLLEYSESNDLDSEIVAELIEAEMLDHLDDALESGEISQEEYDERSESVEEAVQNRLNGEKPERKQRGRR